MEKVEKIEVKATCLIEKKIARIIAVKHGIQFIEKGEKCFFKASKEEIEKALKEYEEVVDAFLRSIHS